MSAEAVATALVARSGAMRAQPDQFVRLPDVSTDPAYVEGKHGAQRFLLAWLRETRRPAGADAVPRRPGTSSITSLAAFSTAPLENSSGTYWPVAHSGARPPSPSRC